MSHLNIYIYIYIYMYIFRIYLWSNLCKLFCFCLCFLFFFLVFIMHLLLFSFFTENEKLKVLKKINFLQQTSTICRLHKSNCFTKGMPYRFGSSFQGMSCFEYACVFSKKLKSYVQVSLEANCKFKNLTRQ